MKFIKFIPFAVIAAALLLAVVISRSGGQRQMLRPRETHSGSSTSDSIKDNLATVADLRSATVPSAMSDPIDPARLQKTDDPGLEKLAEYEIAGKGEFGGMMIFAQMPVSGEQAAAQAESMAAVLKKYSSFDIKPLVVIEPILESGAIIDFSDFGAGSYDTPLENYFSVLRREGISDSQMGMWVPFPEPNTDSWGVKNSKPADFVRAFNDYAAVFKKYFPGAQLSLLLDNQTYDYRRNDYAGAPLEPYLAGIGKSNISSFGLQGFPWAPGAASNDRPIYDAAEFLSAAPAIEAAKSLGVASIWFNTGTFAAMYAADPVNRAVASPAQRAAILASILGQANTVKKAGFDIAINIFAQNKSKEAEAIDWSYWNGLSDIGNPNGLALSEFVLRARAAGIFLYAFDSK
jgi:hypothetical protein